VGTAARSLTSLFLLLALAGCGSGSSAETDEKAVRDLLAHIQQSFNAGNLDEFMPVFADDAVMMNQGQPDVVGKDAIRAVYDGALAQLDIQTRFDTEELQVAGDLAYERGTYTLHMKDKSSGQSLPEVKNRHIHIFRRNADGKWQTWRMMTNSGAVPPPMSGAPQ
jgi:uncharacterized protein (TIGR02246 family)